MTSDPRVHAGGGGGGGARGQNQVHLFESVFLKKHLSESIHTWIIDTM